MRRAKRNSIKEEKTIRDKVDRWHELRSGYIRTRDEKKNEKADLRRASGCRRRESPAAASRRDKERR